MKPEAKLKLVKLLPRFQWRPLEHWQVIRVDSLCPGPADIEKQVHARYPADLMRRLLGKAEGK